LELSHDQLNERRMLVVQEPGPVGASPGRVELEAYAKGATDALELTETHKAGQTSFDSGNGRLADSGPSGKVSLPQAKPKTDGANDAPDRDAVHADMVSRGACLVIAR
jgi:hypothetical protein